MEKSKLDKVFAIPALAVILAIVCNVVWGTAFPFIKMGYTLFNIESTDTASIMCFAGVRFMVGAVLVYVCGCALQRRLITFPRGKEFASCFGLALLQTTFQYTFYYTAVAWLTGAMGGIINCTQSFMGVVLAHFLYGQADRLTVRKVVGCVLGFAGVLTVTMGNHGTGSTLGIVSMLLASLSFTLAGAWNKSITHKVDSFAVTTINLGLGGLVLLLMGLALGGSLHPESTAAVPVLLYLAFVSGAGYVLWALLVKNNPLSRISIFCLLIPVVNVLLSAVLNGETLFELQYFVALIFMCVGIWLVNRAMPVKAE